MFLECKFESTIDTGEGYAFLADVVNCMVDEKYFVKNLWISNSVPMHLGGGKIVYFKSR